ncbi:MAG: Lipid biosynthesis lauroyl acyltransferase, partial [Bacteroidota bacterium]
MYLTYIFFRAMVLLAQIMPYSLLYWFSDIVTFFLYRIIGYRKNLIFSQLKKCFPEKSESEIAKIAHDSYQNLSDLLVETFKGMTFVESDIYARFRKKGEGWAQANAVTASGSTFIGTGAHIANWEWAVLAMQVYLEGSVLGIYKPIQN